MQVADHMVSHLLRGTCCCCHDHTARQPTAARHAGKQSLARLAAFICGYEVFQIAVSSTYGVNEFKAVRLGHRGMPRSHLKASHVVRCINFALPTHRRTCYNCTTRPVPRARQWCCC